VPYCETLRPHALLIARASADSSAEENRGVLLAYGSTDKGPLRPINEDCFGIDEQLGLCVLADGMGGHNAGEIAARIAVDAVADYVRDPAGDVAWPFGFEPSFSEAGNLLRTAVLLANVQILEAAATVDEYSGMGTTIVAALVRGGRLSVAHVGDSRLYVLGPGLRQLTHDDSWTATVLAADSRMDPVLLQNHPMRNALTNVVGLRACTDVHILEQALRVGDRLVLTTDGVHGILEGERLQSLASQGDVRTASQRLISAALAGGSRDNCSAVVAEYT
jgi:serine/threonine protein phosphatase PrpC